MITESKKCKTAFLAFTLLCFIAIVVCFICNLVINRRITWAGYPACAIPFAWAVISAPLLAKKHRLLCALFTLSVALVPLLYFIERLTPVRGWFYALGIPIAITAIITIWITYALFKFLRVRLNIWYLSAIIVFLYGVVVGTVVQYFTSSFLHMSLMNLSYIVNIFSCIIIAALLAVIGYSRNQTMKLRAENENK